MTAVAEREYTTVDKSSWPAGPWQTEPDKIQWLDEETGYDCLIVRGPSGALCGYVGVPPEHPCHGIHYDRVTVPAEPDEEWGGYPDVHGGLTYADKCQESDDGDESKHICHVPLPGRPDDVWWLGFDCAHSGDVSPKYDRDPLMPYESYKDVGYVRRETLRLARQLVTAYVTENE